MINTIEAVDTFGDQVVEGVQSTFDGMLKNIPE